VTEQIHRLTLTPELRAESPYLAVPFEVPPGTESIEVELCFVHRSTRIDIGCEGVLAAEEPGPYRLENAARATLAMTM
jgi:hypothetical protein